MAVYDRWHLSNPEPGGEPCEHSRGKRRLYPSGNHLQGKRWQVQWDDPDSPTRRRFKRNFDLRDGSDRNVHADAFDKHIQGTLVARTYTDPRAGEIRLQDYAETWRATRGHNDQSAALLAARLRNHVYEGEPRSGRAPRGALAIGQHPIGFLAARPTVIAAWVASLKGPLPAERSRRQVVDEVAAVFAAAAQDGIVNRNPFGASVVDKPGRGGGKARPFTAAQLDAIAGHLPERLQVLPVLGAGTGARAMELAALGTDDVQFLGRRPRVRVERQLKRIDGRAVFAPLKNRKPHELPLSPTVAAALAQHLADHPPAQVTLPWHDPGGREHGRPVTVRLVLLGDDGGPLTRAALQAAWRTASARAAGTARRDGQRHLFAPGQNLHRLRHTYASMQLRKGVDVVRVAAWMGDTADVVVKTYAHLMPEDDGDADGRAAVDEFFGACAPDVPSEGAGGGSAQAERR